MSWEFSEILTQAARTDGEAWQRLIDQVRPLLTLVARKHMRRRYRARFDESDVVQITCLEAFRSFGAFRGRTVPELFAWLETILKRSLANLEEHHESQKRNVHCEVVGERLGNDNAAFLSVIWNVIAASSAGPVSRVMLGEKAVILATTLEQLPEDYRQAIELRFLDGRKLNEIARELETTIGHIAGLLRRGLDELNELLPDQLSNEMKGTDH